MKSVVNRSIVLVLNRNWQPVSVTTPADALSAMMTGVATGLDIAGRDLIQPTDWDKWLTLPIKENDFTVGTVRGPIRVPTVIVLTRYNRVPIYRPSFSLRAIWVRDGGRCQYSGRSLKPGEGNIDHVVPQSRGGPTSWENCVLSDKTINTRRADRTPQEAGLKLLRAPMRPEAVPVYQVIRNRYAITDWDIFLAKREHGAAMG